MSWAELTSWWLQELHSDAAYESEVTPLALGMLEPTRGATYLDLGSGEGRVLRAMEESGAVVYGLDLNESLARKTGAGRVMVGRLPSIPTANDLFDGAYAVLVLEHIEDHRGLFTECARVTKKGGVLAVVMNHPIWTAPHSTPITDSDGEVLWRPGGYFSMGTTELPAGEEQVTFHHRPIGELLNTAAESGWVLRHMVERPHHELEDQAGIPRLLACRWSLEG